MRYLFQVAFFVVFNGMIDRYFTFCILCIMCYWTPAHGSSMFVGFVNRNRHEAPQCDETRFSTIQPSIDVTGIRNGRWQWRKNDAVILVALVACTKFGVKGQSKLKLLSGNWISIFSNSDLDLDHRHLDSNPKLRLDVSYPYTKFGVNSPKQTKVIERKLNFYF